MSDGDPPGEPPGGSVYPEPPPPPHGFAALPLWARILIPVTGVLVLVLIGAVVWQAAQADEEVGTIEDVLEEIATDEQNATTTVPPPITSAAAPTSTMTTVAAATATTEATSTTSTSTTTTTTVAPTITTTTTSTTSTTVRPTTTSTSPSTTTTTVRPTTTLARTATSTTTTTTTTVAPTTNPVPTTEAPATTPVPTTEASATTPVPTTLAPSPTLPVAPGAIAPNARGFAESWNANASATDVPALTENEITALENGPAATTFIAPLSDYVGLVGVVRNDDSSVAQALLVWIPGGDQAATNQLYRDAFDVLLRTVNPDLDVVQRAEVGSDLGLSEGAPPFPANETVSAEAFPDRYSRFVRDTSAADGTAIISVVDARPR